MRTDLETDTAEVLVAARDPEDRSLLVRALRRCRPGLSIATAHDGQELLKQLRAREHFGHALPRLVLLDVERSGAVARELLQAVMDDPLLRAVPVVLLTASAHAEEQERLRALGAVAVLHRPASFEALSEVMHTLLDRWLANDGPRLGAAV